MTPERRAEIRADCAACLEERNDFADPNAPAECQHCKDKLGLLDDLEAVESREAELAAQVAALREALDGTLCTCPEDREGVCARCRGLAAEPSTLTAQASIAKRAVERDAAVRELIAAVSTAKMSLNWDGEAWYAVDEALARLRAAE